MSSSGAEQTSRRPRTPSRRRSSPPGRRGSPIPRATRRAGSSPPPGASSSTSPEASRHVRRARPRSSSNHPRVRPSTPTTRCRSTSYCAHPSLSPSSAVALTLRAVGGLTTKQIAAAYLVPEATMAQRISRAKRALVDVPLDSPGDLATVLRTLYLVFNEGYTGDVDLSAEAIRLTRQVADADRPPGGPRPARPDAPAPRAPRLAHRHRRSTRHPPRPGPHPLGHDPHRRGRRRPPGSSRSRPARRVPGPGRHRRPARRRRCPTTRPTGSRSSSGTTSC